MCSILAWSSAFCAPLATLLQGLHLESSRFLVLLSLSLTSPAACSALSSFFFFFFFGGGVWEVSFFIISYSVWLLMFMMLLSLPPLRRYGRLLSLSLTLNLRLPGLLRDYCFVILRSLIFSCGSPARPSGCILRYLLFFLLPCGLDSYYSV